MDVRRFAFSTGCFAHLALLRALAQIAAAGFSKVQIRADAPHLWLDRTSPADIASLRRQIQKTGLSVVGIDATRSRGFWSDASPEPIFEPSLISSDRRLREWRIAYVKKALRLARELGAENVTVASGRVLGGMAPNAALKLLDEGLLRLLEHADGLGQSLALTCEPALLVESNSEIAAVLKRLNAPHLMASVDVASKDSCASVRQMKGRIGSVRLTDAQLEKASIIRLLNEVGANAAVIWDLDERIDAAEACRRTYKFVKQLKK